MMTNHGKETEVKTMFVLMSHEMTPVQIEDARSRWGVGRFVTVPCPLWGQIPPEADSVCDAVEPARAFLRREARPGDLLLVQGDFGATVAMIGEARKLGLTPLYATTRRVADERVEGDRVVTTRHFEHVRFRVYETECIS
jgi:hypothetical protein